LDLIVSSSTRVTGLNRPMFTLNAVMMKPSFGSILFGYNSMMDSTDENSTR